MLVKISLVIALCSNLSTGSIQAKMHELQSKFPGSKIGLRIDQKASCDAQGHVMVKKTRNQLAER